MSDCNNCHEESTKQNPGLLHCIIEFSYTLNGGGVAQNYRSWKSSRENYSEGDRLGDLGNGRFT